MLIKSLVGGLLLASLLYGSTAAAHGSAASFAPKTEPVISGVNSKGFAIIKLAKPEMANLVTVSRATAGTQSTDIRTFGQVVPSVSSVLDINANVSGEVKKVFVRVGDSVKAGAAIVSIYNPEFITTQQGQLQLLKNQELLNSLREEGRLPDYLKDARENLKWWGMTEPEINALIKSGRTVQELTLKAPSDGVLTDVFVEPGVLINAGDKTMKAFVVMGKSVARMVTANAVRRIEGVLFQDQQSVVRPGMEVSVELPTQTLKGRIGEVVPGVDPATKKAKFMVDVANNQVLALGQSVNLVVHTEPRQGVWVPRSAVLSRWTSPVAFVEKEKGQFFRRAVTVRGQTKTSLLVEGIAPDENLVTEGKMALEGLYRMSSRRSVPDDDHDHH